MYIRPVESDRSVEIHENLHFRPVSCVAVSSDGSVLVTGEYLNLIDAYVMR